ncbi:MAG: hypothetical protein WA948_07635 [Pontixanthobacter sp.]
MSKPTIRSRIRAIGLMALAPLAFAFPAAAQDSDGDAAPLTKGEVKLAKMLEGRVAGKPQSCIRTFPNSDMTVIDRTAIVYEVGSTLYVNIPAIPRSLDDRDTMVRRTSFASQLCNTDIVTTIDPVNGFYTGNIFLGQFVPYEKVDS